MAKIINPFEEEIPPSDKNGNPKVKFEVKMRKNPNGTLEKQIFIDNELLDWAVDASSLMEAMKMGNHIFKEVQKSIETHFVESVSEVLNRRVTAKEIKEAIISGWI